MSNLSKAERRAAAAAANAARLQANAAPANPATPPVTAPVTDQQLPGPLQTEPVVQQNDPPNQAGDQQKNAPGDAETSDSAGAGDQEQGSTDDQQNNDPADQQGQQDGANAGDDQQGQQQQSGSEPSKGEEGPLVAQADEPPGPVVPDGDIVTVVTVHSLKFTADYTEPGTTLQLKREMAVRLLGTGAVKLP